jgi:hypothetical protein
MCRCTRDKSVCDIGVYGQRIPRSVWSGMGYASVYALKAVAKYLSSCHTSASSTRRTYRRLCAIFTPLGARLGSCRHTLDMCLHRLPETATRTRLASAPTRNPPHKQRPALPRIGQQARAVRVAAAKRKEAGSWLQHGQECTAHYARVHMRSHTQTPQQEATQGWVQHEHC